MNLNRLFKIEPREWPLVLGSFFFVFTLMAAYYLLRPVRDAMASDWSDAELSWLWTLTFFVSAAGVFLYGAAVSRIGLRRLVPGVYLFFAASFVLFYLISHWPSIAPLADKAFYVWVSFFALFHVSVFWSFMADIFSKPQSKRLFGFIGAGASIGAVTGPAITVMFSAQLGVYRLLFVAAILLVLLVPLIYFLEGKRIGYASTPATAMGGKFFEGFVEFFSHRFLLGIGLFILLYTMMSSFVYFELKNVMADFDRETRAFYWGLMDLIVNTIAIATALFATGRITLRWGLAITLALIPALLVIGWLIVAAIPGLFILIALQVTRRAGNYAITRPGREMLFTSVNRQTRFKTKPVIDIVVYRGGDVLAGWTYTGLAQGIGLGLGAIAIIAAFLALIWMAVALFLGTRFEQNKQTTTDGALL